MATLHFNLNEKARLSALMEAHGITEYAVLKQLVYLGLERVDAGEPLFGARLVRLEELVSRLEKRLYLGMEKYLDSVIEKRLKSVFDRLQESRNRDLNMTLELLEQTIWLRVLVERIRPGAQPTVDERVKNAADRLLPLLNSPPPAARRTKIA